MINSGEKGGLVKKLFFKGLAAKSAVLEGKVSEYSEYPRPAPMQVPAAAITKRSVPHESTQSTPA